MQPVQAIAHAIDGYLDLMYNADDSRFPEVFHDAALVHGMRDGTLTMWSAAEFRDVMRGRPSPASLGSPRDQAVLDITCIADDLAVTQVRVRIGQIGFLDHLIWHRIDGSWRVTAKAFHVAQVFPAGS